MLWHTLVVFLHLINADATLLAERYDFNGGQIENIARHYVIDAILHGNAAPTANNLMPYCDSERISNTSSKKIGFTR